MKNSTRICKMLVLLACFGVYASQAKATTVLFEDFAKCTAGTPNANASGTEISATLNNYTTQVGWTGSKVYQAGGTVKFGTSSAMGYIVTPSLDLSANAGTFYLSFDACAWSGDATNIKIYLNDVEIQNVTGLSNSANYEFASFGPFAFTGGTSTSKVKISASVAAKGRFFLDNVRISQYATSEPRAFLSSATFMAEVSKTQTKNVVLQAANLTGDLTVSMQSTTGNDFSTTVTTVPSAQSNGFVLPITYAPLAAGKDTVVLTVSGGGLAEPFSVTLAGDAWSAVDVPNLAALRAAFDANPTDVKTIYRIPNEVIMSYKTTVSNTKYFQDATGGICVYDVAGTITTPLSVGDGVKGLIGTMLGYNGLIEFIPIANVPAANTIGNSILPAVLTIPELNASRERYECVLIQVKNVTTNATGNYAASKSYSFWNGTDSVVLRVNNNTLDYIGTALPTAGAPMTLTGVMLDYMGVNQIMPRNASEIQVYTGLPANVFTSDVYGNNGFLHIQTIPGARIQAFDWMGRMVLETNAASNENSFYLGTNRMLFVRVNGKASKVML